MKQDRETSDHPWSGYMKMERTNLRQKSVIAFLGREFGRITADKQKSIL